MVIRNKFRLILIISFALLVAFSFIYATYTIPREVELGGEWYPDPNASNPSVPRTLDEIESRLLGSIIIYFVISFLTLYLAFKVYQTIKLVTGIRKESLLYLATYFFIVGIAALYQAVAILIFYIEGYSATKMMILDFKLYFYPLSIPVSTALITISILFIPLFGYLTSEKKYPSKSVMTIMFILVVLELIALVFPENWFGCYRPFRNGQPLYPDFRPISTLILFVVFLYGTLITAIRIYKRQKIVEDPVAKGRLKILMYSFLLIDLYFIFYVIDAVVGGGFTIFMFMAAIFGMIAFVSMYLAILTPEWLMAKLSRSSR